MKTLDSFSKSVNILFSSEISNKNATKSVYRKAHMEIKRDTALAEVRLKNRVKGARLFAVKVMRRAMRYEVSESVLFIALRLVKFHPTEGNWREIEKYQRIVEEYQQIVFNEIEAEKYLIDIKKEILKKIHNDHILEKINRYVTKLDALFSTTDSFNFLMYAHSLKLYKYRLENNREGIIRICSLALEQFKNKPFSIPDVTYVLFSNQMIPGCIETGQYSKAKELIDICYNHSKKKTNNWFVAHSFDVLLRFQLKDFDRVNQLLKAIKTYPNETIRERYEIYKAYNALFAKERFRIGKFMNEVVGIAHDKQGYNIAILIAQLLHLLKARKYDQYIDKLHATEVYIKRYINFKQVLRSRYFLKILLLVPKCNRNAVNFENKTKDLYLKLTKANVSHSKPSVELELVPYEYLYGWVKSILK